MMLLLGINVRAGGPIRVSIYSILLLALTLQSQHQHTSQASDNIVSLCFIHPINTATKIPCSNQRRKRGAIFSRPKINIWSLRQTSSNMEPNLQQQQQQQQQQQRQVNDEKDNCWSRRNMLISAVCMNIAMSAVPVETSAISMDRAYTKAHEHLMKEVRDPNTYSALTYIPPQRVDGGYSMKPLPLIFVLHGAGKNEQDIWNLANIQGEHAGLIPSLIDNNLAPEELVNDFAVVAPYSQGRASFYEEPRSKIIQFLNWVCSEEGVQAGCPRVDPDNVFLFGFSDGATLGVELLTTRRFRAGAVAAYGFTGTLPALALDRLKGIPLWVFHSADDVIFNVQCSDNLVRSLRKINNDKSIIKYSRFDSDQEGFTGSVRGHSTGITASKLPDLYRWMLSMV